MPLFKGNYKLNKNKKVTRRVILNPAEKNFICFLNCKRYFDKYILNEGVLVPVHIKVDKNINHNQILNYIILP